MGFDTFRTGSLLLAAPSDIGPQTSQAKDGAQSDSSATHEEDH
jgi:hypothetical protein